MRQRVLADKRVLVACAVGFCLLWGLVFFWIGYAARPPPDTSEQERLAASFRRLLRNERSFSGQQVAEQVSSERLKGHLQYLSQEPHIAGQPQHARTAAYFKEHLGGLDGFQVSSANYSVSIGQSAESYFTIVLGNGTQLRSQVQEKFLLPELEDRPGQVYPILSYTPAGNVSGRQVVYANYGSERDFQELLGRGLNLTGTLALMRYGRVGRGKKLVNAGAVGCVGGIVYSDPKDQWAQPHNLSDVYPDSWWLPPTGVQRGSAKMRQADPQTPDYPSLDFAFREEYADIQRMEDPRVLAPIPGYPVGYGDARMLLERLDGEQAPADWQGGLPLNYNVGGSFRNDANASVSLLVQNSIADVVGENVFAVMEGDLEPDRYVLIGNHRDAWGTGVVDATTGSAAVLELAEVLNQLYTKAGKKPRRSIVICSWDVEEQGITGSWEWVEDKFPQIKDKVVAYVNIDIAVRGNYVVRPNADPLLQQVTKTAMKNVPDVTQDGRTMFQKYEERWIRMNRSMTVPISSSDYSAFIQKAGVPIIDVSAVADPTVSTYYPIYHSIYETFKVMEEHIDPGFVAHKEVVVWATELVRLLADSWLVPYDEMNLVRQVREMYTSSDPPAKWNFTIGNEKYLRYCTSAWTAFGEALAQLEEEAKKLTEAADAMQTRIDNGDTTIDPMQVRSLNDVRMRSMQALTDYHGQPRDPTKHNMFFSATSEELWGGPSVRIPGLADLLAVAKKDCCNPQRWKEVSQHVSALVFRVHSLRYLMQRRL